MSTAPIAAPSRRASRAVAAAPAAPEAPKPVMPTKAEIEALMAKEPGLKFPAARMRLYRAARPAHAPATKPAAASPASPASPAKRTAPAPVAAAPAPVVARAARATKPASGFIVTVVDIDNRKTKTAFVSSDIAGKVAGLVSGS